MATENTKDQTEDQGQEEEKQVGQLPQYEGSPASVYYDGEVLKSRVGEGTPNDPNTNEPVTGDPRIG